MGRPKGPFLFLHRIPNRVGPSWSLRHQKWASKMAQWINCIPYKPNDLTSILRTHTRLDVMEHIWKTSLCNGDSRFFEKE